MSTTAPVLETVTSTSEWSEWQELFGISEQEVKQIDERIEETLVKLRHLRTRIEVADQEIKQYAGENRAALRSLMASLGISHV